MKNILIMFILVFIVGCTIPNQNTPKTTVNTTISSIVTNSLSKDGFEVSFPKLSYNIKEVNVYKKGWLDNALKNRNIDEGVNERLKEAFLKKNKAIDYIGKDSEQYYKLTAEAQSEIKELSEFLKKDTCVSVNINSNRSFIEMNNHIYLYDDLNKRFYRFTNNIIGDISTVKKSTLGKCFNNVCEEYFQGNVNPICNPNQNIYVIVVVEGGTAPDECKITLENKVDPPNRLDCDINKIKEKPYTFVFEVNVADIKNE